MTTKQETLNKVKAELNILKAGNSWINSFFFLVIFLIIYGGYYWCFYKWGPESTMGLSAIFISLISYELFKKDLIIIKLNKRISDIENKLLKKEA
jgi:hypothetical protein